MPADALDGAPRDDGAARDAEEALGVELLLERVERALDEIARAFVGHQVVGLLFGEEEGDPVGLQGDDLLTDIDHDALLVGFGLPARHDGEQLLHVDARRRGRALAAAAHRARQLLGADGLEEVVHAPGLEGLEGVGVIGGGHDDAGLDGYLPEDLEAVAVGELDIHEDKVYRRVRGEVFDGPADGIGDLHHLDVREVGLEQAHELRLGHAFVFDYQGFHHRSGRVTV